MTHKIKIDKPYADAIVESRKTFEVRYNDRGYNTGDKVEFIVYDGYTPISHPLNDCIYDITYVQSGFGVESDHVVFQIKEEEKQITVDIFDKIREEIDNINGKIIIEDYVQYGSKCPKYVELDAVLKILDKYKAESEK